MILCILWINGTYIEKKNGKIKTNYQNILYVPTNVYLILNGLIIEGKVLDFIIIL